MQDSSVNHLSLVPLFVSSDAHLLWKLMTKEERLLQRYEICNARGIREKLDLDMDMDKEGAMRNVRG